MAARHGRVGIRRKPPCAAAGSAAPAAVLPLPVAMSDLSTHPQLLHHRAHRPRQEHAGRPPARAHRRHDRARHEGAGARQHGPGARARHHHQGARRAHPVPRARRPALRAQPHRHARPRGLQLRGLAAPWPPARARSWWSTPPRASRRRPSPTPTWPSRTTSRSSRSSTRSTCRPATCPRRATEVHELTGATPDEIIVVSAKTGVGVPRRARGDRRRACRRRRATPAARRAP